MKLTLKEIKGQNKSYELGKTNILVGPFGSGKSTVIQAIKFLIEGTLTDGGITKKTGEELFKLSSGKSMEVEAEFNGETYARGIDQVTKGVEVSYKKTGSNSAVISKATQTEILSSITTDLGVDSAVLNFSEFANLSASDQKKYIFGLYPSNFEKWDEEAILNYLIGKFSEDFDAEQIKDVCRQVAKICVTKGVNAAIEYVTAKYNDLNAQKKKDDVGMQELTRIKQDNTESVKGLAKLESDQILLANELSKISTRVSEAKHSNQNVLSNALQRAEMLQKINVIEFKLNEPVEKPSFEQLSLKDVEEIKNRIEELGTILTGYQADLYNADENLKELEEVKTTYKQEIQIQNDLLAAEMLELSKREERKRGIKETLGQLKEFSGKCPLCPVVECKTDMTPAITGLESEISNITKSIDETLENVKRHNETIEKMDQELVQHNLLIATAIESITVIKTECANVQLRIDQNQLDLALTNQANESAVKRNEENKRASEVFEIENAERIANLNGQKQEHQQRIDEIDLQDTKILDVELIELEHQATKNRLDEVNEQIKVKVKAKSDLENLAKKEFDAELTASEWALYKLLKDAVGQKGLAGQMIVEAIEPMVVGVNENIQAFGLEDTFYVDTENFNFGLSNGVNLRSYETLSNGETLILTAAIVIEFMQKTCKNRVLLLDNLNDIDNKSALWFVNGINKLNHKYDICVMAANFTDPDLIKNISSVESINIFEL